MSDELFFRYSAAAVGGSVSAARQYLFGLITCAFLVSLLQSLCKDDRAQRMVRLLGGCVLVLTALSPLLHLELQKPDWGFLEDYGLSLPDPEQKTREILEDLVCEQTRQKIEEQAGLFGFTAQAEVFCTYDQALGTFLPTRVTITAACTQTQKELLSDFLTQQLGIETEAQTWVTGS